MIFQHTLDAVLDGTKTQTSRVWKDNYVSVVEGDNNITVISKSSGRRLYYVGQEHAVQPKRGASGVGRIRITSLGKRNVSFFDAEDIRREGFQNMAEFLSVWRGMHKSNYLALVIRFELVE